MVIITLASQAITVDFHITEQVYAAIAGGLIWGTGSGIMFRSLGSGGGLDIIAVALYNKHNIGIGTSLSPFLTVCILRLFSRHFLKWVCYRESVYK